jgi:hypothetical protein
MSLKLTKILDDILKSLPKEMNTNDYIFVCSKDFKCEITEYKDVKVYYYNFLKKDTVYYMLNSQF